MKDSYIPLRVTLRPCCWNMRDTEKILDYRDAPRVFQLFALAKYSEGHRVPIRWIARHHQSPPYTELQSTAYFRQESPGKKYKHIKHIMSVMLKASSSGNDCSPKSHHALRMFTSRTRYSNENRRKSNVTQLWEYLNVMAIPSICKFDKDFIKTNVSFPWTRSKWVFFRTQGQVTVAKLRTCSRFNDSLWYLEVSQWSDIWPE